ncbi:hypothetical protein ACHAXA_010995 [Cyclostephanos tholiformis]|uniref:Multidrug and toxin extrusion protein n=1 Tax=Cyclostephanos tholiformis TaxID=382380 RepID=A0ABD3RR18_9STRA
MISASTPTPSGIVRLLSLLLLMLFFPPPSPPNACALAYHHPRRHHHHHVMPCGRGGSRLKEVDIVHRACDGVDGGIDSRHRRRCYLSYLVVPKITTTSRRGHWTSSMDSDECDNDRNIISQTSSRSSSSSTTTKTTTTTTPFVGLPSYGRIAHFSATTFLIWVSEPLLSLVDSVAVGRYAGGGSIPSSSSSSSPFGAHRADPSSVVQLAALGPATTLCDGSIYLMLFISMATTNRLARAFAKRDRAGQIRTMSHVLGLSLAAGIFLMLFVNLRGMALLTAILGPTGATLSIAGDDASSSYPPGIVASMDLTREVLRASFGYVRIRSIASPLAVMGLTSQAALLSAQDTRTPAIAVVVASVLNILGDYIFVARFGWGVRGAALATGVASMIANGMLTWKVWTMVCGWKDAYREGGEERGASGHRRSLQPPLDADVDASGSGDDPSEIPFISLPDRKSLASLLLLAGPMFFVMLGKIMGYSAMTVRAGDFGMVSLACHSVMMRVFFFFATAGDAISQAAQTFLPGLLYQKSVRENASQVAAVSSSTTKTDLSDSILGIW